MQQFDQCTAIQLWKRAVTAHLKSEQLPWLQLFAFARQTAATASLNNKQVMLYAVCESWQLKAPGKAYFSYRNSVAKENKLGLKK